MHTHTHTHTPIPQFMHCDFYRPDLILSFFCKWNGICNISISTLNVLLPKLPSQHLKSLERRAKITLSVYQSKCRKVKRNSAGGCRVLNPTETPPAGSRWPPWRPAKAGAGLVDFSYPSSQKLMKLTGVGSAGKVTVAKWNPWPVFTLLWSVNVWDAVNMQICHQRHQKQSAS